MDVPLLLLLLVLRPRPAPLRVVARRRTHAHEEHAALQAPYHQDRPALKLYRHGQWAFTLAAAAAPASPPGPAAWRQGGVYGILVGAVAVDCVQARCYCAVGAQGGDGDGWLGGVGQQLAVWAEEQKGRYLLGEVEL